MIATSLRRFAYAVALLIFTPCLIPYSLAQHYVITDLGTLPGNSVSMGWGVNSSAVVVGSSANNGFLWTERAGMLELSCGEGSYSFADAINNNGRVVGSCGTSSAETAFLWTPTGGMQNLGALPGGEFSQANGTNNADQVVGTSNYGNMVSSYYLHAFLWTRDGGMTDLGTLPGGTFSLGNAINEAGRVVGYSGLASSSGYHAFVWTKSGGMQDLGVLPGGTYSDAIAINTFGHIVGSSDMRTSSGNVRAVLWTSGGIRRLGILPGASYSFAASINDVGDIVGESGPQGADTSHAVIWDEYGEISDLNKHVCADTGFILLSARAITASGKIAGWGMIDGAVHAFLAEPNEKCP
jgi:probable HAF family extracellular repeat protein